jgi:hypothetical protein
VLLQIAFQKSAFYTPFPAPPLQGARAYFGYYAAWIFVYWYFLALLMLAINKFNMQFWIPLNAHILKINELGDSDKSIWTRPIAGEIKIKYAYSYNGQDFENQKVTVFSFTKHNYSIQLHRSLIEEYRHGRPISIWVNPKKPGQALITKKTNWLDLSLTFIFVLFAYRVIILWMFWNIAPSFCSQPFCFSWFPI